VGSEKTPYTLWETGGNPNQRGRKASACSMPRGEGMTWGRCGYHCTNREGEGNGITIRAGGRRGGGGGVNDWGVVEDKNRAGNVDGAGEITQGKRSGRLKLIPASRRSKRGRGEEVANRIRGVRETARREGLSGEKKENHLTGTLEARAPGQGGEELEGTLGKGRNFKAKDREMPEEWRKGGSRGFLGGG